MGMFAIPNLCKTKDVPMTNDLPSSPISTAVDAANFGVTAGGSVIWPNHFTQ